MHRVRQKAVNFLIFCTLNIDLNFSEPEAGGKLFGFPLLLRQQQLFKVPAVILAIERGF